MCQGTVPTTLQNNRKGLLPRARPQGSHYQHSRPKPRILFGSIFAWMSIVGGRFMAPFLRHEAHFTNDTLIGLTFSVGMGILTVVAPWGGSIADYYEVQYPGKGRTQILQAGVCLGSLVFLCHGMQHLLPSLPLLATTSWHFTLRIIFAIAFAMTMPVLDGITLAHLEETHASTTRHGQNENDDDHDKNDKDDQENSSTASYGKERLHGAIWWALTNLMLGPCLDRWGFQVLYGFAIVSTIVCLWCIRHYTAGQQQQQEEDTTTMKEKNMTKKFNNMKNSESYHNSVETVEGNRHDNAATTIGTKTTSEDDTSKVPMTTLFRFLWGTLYGCTFLIFFGCLRVGTSVVDQMAFLYFEYLHSTYWMCSITVALTVMFEIPIFHYAPIFLKKWGGPGTMQIVAGVAYVTRVVGYTLVPKGHMGYILILEPLHGVTYACSKASSVEFVSRLMPAGYEASGQGILGLFEGLGCMIGLFLGGWMEEHLGPRTMYRLLAFVVMIGMSIFVISIIMPTKENHQEKQQEQSQVEAIIPHHCIDDIDVENRLFPLSKHSRGPVEGNDVQNGRSRETAPLLIEKQSKQYL